MALSKAIKQLDGVTTSYHRISFVQINTNKHNSIAVLSYVDHSTRADELTDPSFTPYRQSTTYETGYSPNMTIELAYEYLKTLPEFEGATDI